MPYSNDLRERVLAAVDAGDTSWREITQRFQVSKATLANWVRRWRVTKNPAALPWAGGRRRSLARCETAIRAQVAAQPDSTLLELCAAVAATTGVHASPSMMCRELAQLRLPVKKRVSMPASGIPPKCNKRGGRSPK